MKALSDSSSSSNLWLNKDSRLHGAVVTRCSEEPALPLSSELSLLPICIPAPYK